MDKDGKKGAVVSPVEDQSNLKISNRELIFKKEFIELIFKMELFALIKKNLPAVLEALDAVEPTK